MDVTQVLVMSYEFTFIFTLSCVYRITLFYLLLTLLT